MPTRNFVFVGGGVTALEFSHVYVRAGARVTILEMLPRLLTNMDADAVAQLHSETERIGVTIHTGVEIQYVERAGDRLRVVYTEDGSEHAIEADRVVNGAGRIADLDGLGLSAGRVATDHGRLLLGAYLRSTSYTAVNACGDAVATSRQLSPIATYEGRTVAATSSKARPVRRIMQVFWRAFSRCRRSRALA
jgi:glutathione reductase (NADPH)